MEKWVQEFYEIPFELLYTYDLEIYISGSFQDSMELILWKNITKCVGVWVRMQLKKIFDPKVHRHYYCYLSEKNLDASFSNNSITGYFGLSIIATFPKCWITSIFLFLNKYCCTKKLTSFKNEVEPKFLICWAKNIFLVFLNTTSFKTIILRISKVKFLT